MWLAIHLGFDLNSLCHKPMSAAAGHPASSTNAASLQPGEAGMQWPQAVAEQAAHRRQRHGDCTQLCLRPEGRCGGRRAGGEGAAAPLPTWLWVLQRGCATGDAGSDQAVWKGGLLCL